VYDDGSTNGSTNTLVNKLGGYTDYRMVPVSTTLSDPVLDFKVAVFFDSKYVNNGAR